MSDILDDPSNGDITKDYADKLGITDIKRDGDPRAFGREYEAQLALGAQLEALEHPELARANLVDPDAPIVVPKVNFTHSARRT